MKLRSHLRHTGTATSTDVVSLRRRLVICAVAALLALVCSIGLAAARPEAAHAIMNPNVVRSGHSGWVYTKRTSNGYVRAYRWSSSWYGYGSWSATYLRSERSVYATPYSDGWHWAWTRTAGWVVVATTDLDTGYHCEGPDCPVF